MRDTNQPTPIAGALRRLAGLYGVHTNYENSSGKQTHASAEAVLEVLRLLGSPARNTTDLPDAVRSRNQELWSRTVEPVAVVRPGRRSSVWVRVAAPRATKRLRCALRLEDGSEHRWTHPIRDASARSREVEGVRHLMLRVPLPVPLPAGYHDLTVEGTREPPRCRVIAAPTQAFGSRARNWGAFLPLYALHSRESWGAGDFSDLERLRDWVGRQGGSFVAILPVLAAHDGRPFDPSPYAPSSRLFWNEFYVDPRRSPELAECARAQQLLASPAFQREIADFRAAPVVDFERQRNLRRGVLTELARSLAESNNERLAELRRYVAAHPGVESYAAFAAVSERRQEPWPEWPEPLRSGVVGRKDRDETRVLYHLYVQWLAEQQLAAVSATSDTKPGLYLDLPLGVHAHGYDTWRHRDAFALDACGGAPPDSVYTQGQDWQFPPLHPERIRAQGYSYFAECLSHQLAHASRLRIDHVMWLHRLYWIPKGWPASQGVYVRYRSEELYAIACLESHRHRASLVGENLGTVPPTVNGALSRHGVQKMYVMQYEARPAGTRSLKTVPPDSVASLNTHDMPPFAAYLRGMDLQDRLALGLLPKSQLRHEQQTRQHIRRALIEFLRRRRCLGPTPVNDATLMRASLAWLAKSHAAAVLINLEDLWMETIPQNLPGTGLERPNWQRKARYRLDDLTRHRGVTMTLRGFAEARKQGRHPSSTLGQRRLGGHPQQQR